MLYYGTLSLCLFRDVGPDGDSLSNKPTKRVVEVEPEIRGDGCHRPPVHCGREPSKSNDRRNSVPLGEVPTTVAQVWFIGSPVITKVLVRH